MTHTADNTTSTASQNWIIYARTSTKRQNLSLEAQRKDIEARAEQEGANIIATYWEQESGADNERVELHKAMAQARKTGASIAVAKLDRLSRDMGYLVELCFKSGIRFVVLDMPQEAMENHLVFAVFVGLASQERKLISDRTRRARAEQRAKIMEQGFYISKTGKKIDYMSNPMGKDALTDDARAKGMQQRIDNANTDPNNVKSANFIRMYATTGKHTLQEYADQLNERGLLTRRGKTHTRASVQQLAKRFSIAI